MGACTCQSMYNIFVLFIIDSIFNIVVLDGVVICVFVIADDFIDVPKAAAAATHAGENTGLFEPTGRRSSLIADSSITGTAVTGCQPSRVLHNRRVPG